MLDKIFIKFSNNHKSLSHIIFLTNFKFNKTKSPIYKTRGSFKLFYTVMIQKRDLRLRFIHWWSSKHHCWRCHLRWLWCCLNHRRWYFFPRPIDPIHRNVFRYNRATTTNISTIFNKQSINIIIKKSALYTNLQP